MYWNGMIRDDWEGRGLREGRALSRPNDVGEATDATERVPPVRFKGFDGAWEEKRLGESFGLRQERNTDGRETEILSVVKDVGVILYSEKGNLGNRAKEDLTQYNIARKNDIVLNSMNVIIGSVGVSKYDGCISPAYYAIFPKEETDSSFWGYWFWRKETKGLISSRACGMMEIRRKISSDDLFDLVVNTPTKDEQQKIGAAFRAVDGLIAGREKALEKLKELKKAMLIKMFPPMGTSHGGTETRREGRALSRPNDDGGVTDATERVPPVRFKGFSGAWEEKRLGDVCKFSKGKGYSKADICESGTPLFLYGRMYTDYEAEVSAVDTFCRPNDGSVYSTGKEVVCPASGETAEDIARASAVVSKGIILGGDLNILTPCGDIDALFLALSMSNGRVSEEIATRAQGKTVVHIHNSDFEDINVPFPSLPEQQKIGAYFRALDGLIAGRREEVEKLKQMKKALLDRMFV